jgi:alpha-amylase/alpha-mannosidase (GH57 family)
MYWANFLHIYQPPTQSKEILLKVTAESYRKILDGLLQHPNAKITLNINGCLTEMLATNGCGDVIENIITLLKRKQIELTASANYHPFLPKLPKAHIIRQIQLNTEINKKYFGDLYEPKGFFPPEMGFDDTVGEIVKQLGYTWIILDELACSTPLDPTKTYEDADGMNYFFRERSASYKILTAQLGNAQNMMSEFGQRLLQEQYLLTAMDGETFGHHRLGLEQLLVEIYKSPEIPTVLISELLTLFPNKIVVTPRPSSWALMPKDVLKNRPFGRWDDPDNPVHKKQWELTYFVLDLAKKEGPAQQNMVDAALYSDQYWWASAKPWWSLEMIEHGAHRLLGAIKNFHHASESEKKRADELYIDIIRTGFEWQRNGTVARLSRAEDEEIRSLMHMQEGKTTLQPADFTQMIDSLEKQMLTAAANREYLRAESLRKRLVEVESEMNKIPVNYTEDIKVNQ